jgi:hypothetical protein
MKMRTILLTISALLLALSSHGQSYEVYISDAGNFGPPNQIIKVDENGENAMVFADEELDWPQDIIFLEDQNLMIVSNLNSNKITQYNASTGAYVGDFATGINGPTRMVIGEDSLLYVLQWSGTNPVLRYQLDGTLKDEFTSIGINSSIGIAWDDAGNLYISSYNGFVRKFDPQGNDQGTFASTNLSGPTNIWFDEEGNLLVIDWTDGDVKKFDSGGEYMGIFIEDLPNGEGIAHLPNGDLIIGCGGDDDVKRYQPDGTYVNDFVADGTLNMLLPNAVVLRETVVSSTHTAVEEAALVTPSIGRQFYWMGDYDTNQLTLLQVVSPGGQINNLPMLSSGLLWNAEKAPAGVYIILAQLKNGQQLRQKVVVTN